MGNKKCPVCKSPVKGRSDKKYCSTKCRSFYHNGLKNATQSVTERTDKLLHRNRSILLEIMGKNARQKKVNMVELERRKFNFSYCTGIYENAQGKRYYNVYDFAYMRFSDGTVLIIKRHN